MSLLSQHSTLLRPTGKGPSTSTLQTSRQNGDIRNVGGALSPSSSPPFTAHSGNAGYLTPPFSPTSTSSRSDYVDHSTGPTPFGALPQQQQQPKERTRDKLAKEVRKAKEKGKQKLLDSGGGNNGYRRSAVVDEEGVEHDPECTLSLLPVLHRL